MDASERTHTGVRGAALAVIAQVGLARAHAIDARVSLGAGVIVITGAGHDLNMAFACPIARPDGAGVAVIAVDRGALAHGANAPVLYGAGVTIVASEAGAPRSASRLIGRHRLRVRSGLIGSARREREAHQRGAHEPSAEPEVTGGLEAHHGAPFPPRFKDLVPGPRLPPPDGGRGAFQSLSESSCACFASLSRA